MVDLRLLCSMYVSTTDARRRVNYEKLLSFIAACVNSMNESGKKPTYPNTTKRVEMQGDGLVVLQGDGLVVMQKCIVCYVW